MITLITGVPGTGKTAHVVAQMAAETKRPFFVMGIPDLKVPHSPVPPVADWVEMRADPDDATVMLPYFTFPPHSIVVIDEAQRIYRPRSAGTKVPPIVAAFETHRHTGVDFWLITQGPALLDSNIRRLVTKHWHIHPTPFGRKLLEWSQCRDPDSKSDRNDALKSNYSPPKSAFSLYRSAEVHTTVKRGIPKTAVLAVACLFLASALGVYAYGRIKARVNGPVPALAEQSGPVQKISPPPAASASPSSPVAKPAPTLADYVAQFSPVHPDYPESAPAYDAIRIVKAVPVVAGCIKTETFCRCYSQQGTPLEVQAARCGDIVKNKVFDPYRDPVVIAAAPVAAPVVSPDHKEASPAPVPPAVLPAPAGGRPALSGR